MKLLFMVNGANGSAAAARAQAIAQRLPQDWRIKLVYRPARKWQGICSFLDTALKFRPDIVYVMDTAYTGVLAGRLAKMLAGCRFVIDTGDVAYELAKSTGNYSRRQLALIQWVEHLAMNHADWIVVRGSFHQTVLEQDGKRNVTFIPDGVDTEVVRPVDATDLRRQLNLTDTLVMGVVGTMAWSHRHQMCYGWDVIEALGLLKGMPVKALLVGDGDGRPILEARAKELGVTDQVVFAGTKSYDELPLYISAMDVCISTQSNDLVGKVRTTGKLPLYLACDKYVIATDVGEASRVLPGIGCLLPYQGVRDDEHPRRLAEHIREIAADPMRVDCRQNASRTAAENFDCRILANRVQCISMKLLEPERIPTVADSDLESF